MNDYYNKILSLLEKENLSETDKNYLAEIAGKNPEVKSFLNTYGKLGKIVKDTSHITLAELQDYILEKNNLNDEHSISLMKFSIIKNHLNSCKSCFSIYEELSAELNAADTAINKFIIDSVSRGKERDIKTQQLFKNKLIRYPIFSAVSILVLFLALEIFSTFTTPKNFRLGQINDKPLSAITRGRLSLEFQEGLAALDNGDYGKAISFFENDLINNKNGNSIFYTHYILGLTYLESAKKDFLGLFISFDTNDILKAVDNFNLCITDNISGNFPDVSFNAYFFMAKAEIILNNTALAKKYLGVVIDNKGSKLNEAKELLNKLE